MLGMTPRPRSIAAPPEPWPGWAGPALDDAFFARDTVTVARELIGCLLVSVKGGVTTGGRIVETEAYLGSDDPGSHAATRGITARNAVMYGPPAHAYVYFTYGNHHMLNLVTEPDGTAGAVLVRAIEPLLGVEAMSSRRHDRPLRELANGPGKLAAALGLDLSDNASRLGRGAVRVYRGCPPEGGIGMSGRIGLSAGHELHLRFFDQGDPHVSRGRVGPAPSRRGPACQKEE